MATKRLSKKQKQDVADFAAHTAIKWMQKMYEYEQANSEVRHAVPDFVFNKDAYSDDNSFHIFMGALIWLEGYSAEGAKKRLETDTEDDPNNAWTMLSDYQREAINRLYRKAWIRKLSHACRTNQDWAEFWATKIKKAAQSK